VLLFVLYVADGSRQKQVTTPLTFLESDVVGQAAQVPLFKITCVISAHMHVLFAYHLSYVFVQVQAVDNVELLTDPETHGVQTPYVLLK
jgi:hypothetical protein